MYLHYYYIIIIIVVEKWFQNSNFIIYHNNFWERPNRESCSKPCPPPHARCEASPKPNAAFQATCNMYSFDLLPVKMHWNGCQTCDFPLVNVLRVPSLMSYSPYNSGGPRGCWVYVDCLLKKLLL